MSTKRPTILLAGGGSGGHIFPNLAVVERLAERGVDVTPHLLVSKRAVDLEIAEASGLAWSALPAAPLGRSPRRAAKFASGFWSSRLAVREIIRSMELGPVLGLVATGGFVSGPAVHAGRSMGVPVAVVSLDAKAGRANRWMARKADAVFGAFSSDGLRDRSGRAAEVIGFPLRSSAVATCSSSEASEALGLDPAKRTLLVFAGSQGATTINQFMAAWVARPGMARSFDGWQVLHYAGPGRDDVAALRLAYAGAGVTSVVEPFGHRMGLAWASADLALTRAGAGTVAEAWANAVPTVFLPYPHHRDEHQRLNALPLVEFCGAVLLKDRIEPSENVLPVSEALGGLMSDDAVRSAMSAALRDHPMLDGAGRIADWIAEHVAMP